MDEINFSSPKECRKAFGGTPEGVNIPPRFLTLWICILFQVFLHVLFERKKDEKRPAQVEQATPVLCSCHFGEHSIERCLSLVSAVPISETKELASRSTNIAWRTRSDTFVLFPLLELTRAVAQHHAGFVFGITFCMQEM